MTAVMLIGDSITAGFDTQAHFPDGRVINKGVSGDSTNECLERVCAEWFRTPPEAVFVCIGTNDFARDRSDEYILGNIRRIVEKIRGFAGGQEIFCTSIFPTRRNDVRPNGRITRFNAQLKQLSEDLGCHFFDLHPHFTDEEGMLRQEFTEDGLHLTAAAYDLWSRLLSALLDG